MYTIPEVRQNTKQSSPDYGKWAVVRKDIPSSPGDIGLSFPGEDMEFLNANLVWQDEPFIMDTEKETQSLLAHYNAYNAL